MIALNAGLIALAVGLAGLAFQLDRLWPFRLPGRLTALGWPLLAAGALLILWAAATLALGSGATGAPGDPTGRLVAAGPYRWVRNPIYGGDALLLFAIAFLTGSPTLLLIAALFLPAIHSYVRFVEEPRTERRLGQPYRDYLRSVPRWVPRRPGRHAPPER